MTEMPGPPLYNIFVAVQVTKPPSLGEEAWAAVTDNVNRLNRALASNDRPQCVGSCKEFVESVARVVLEARGEPASDGDEFDKVLSRAHELIQYQTGDDLVPDDHVRKAASQAKKLAAVLREFRNERGTGHGRAALPDVEDEVLEMCIAGSLIWARWALRRLEHFILGDVQPLVEDLRSNVFYRGSLRRRLEAVGLPHLSPPDQRRLGVSVGRRAATGTFTVRADGIAACIEAQDPSAWPLAYRAGLVEGLFIDEFGQVRLDEEAITAPRVIAELHSGYGDMKAALLLLRSQLDSASWSPGFARRWRAVVAEMTLVEGSFAPEDRGIWLAIKDDLTRKGTEYEGS